MSGPDLLSGDGRGNPADLRIILFHAENVKRLEVVEIRPDGDVVEITGKNGQGKTSVLDAIWWALDGSRNIADEPIRRGAEEGFIRLDLGEIVITRTLSKGDAGVTTALSVRTPQGAEYRRPQQLIDSFFNALSLDPLAFLRMGEKDKFTLVRGFVPDVDFEAIEEANAADYAARRDLNLLAKQQRALVARFVVPNEDQLPAALIDIDALQAELAAAGQSNGLIETRRARREALASDSQQKRARAIEWAEGAERCRHDAEQLLQQATQADAASASLIKVADDLDRRLAEADPLPEPVDTVMILNRLNEARGINTAIDVVRQRGEAEAEARRNEAEAAALTERMRVRLKDATEKIAGARLPVPELTLTPTGAVMLDGFPFEQASDAAQLRASIALAMAMNPRLKVIRVRDGSLLDNDGMDLLRAMAKEHGYQIWIERVAGDGETGFELVAGRLRQRGAREAAA